MADPSIRGYFLWHELMTSDPQSAIAFYSKVVGWKPQKWDEDPSYTLMTYQGSQMAGVMKIPAEAKAMGTPPSWMPYLGTPDIHVTEWEAQRLGGKVHKKAWTIPTVGTVAILEDPQGAAFAAYTPERTPKVGEECPVGDFSWHELATTNHKAAFDFYRELFGWKKTSSYDMGPQGEYLMYGFGEKPLGGIYTKGNDAPGPPAWLSYVRVTDVKATTRTITSAKGQIILEPMEVPGGDWITVAKDPQGAVFAVHVLAKKPTSRPRPSAKQGAPARKKAVKSARTAKRPVARKSKKATKKAKRK
jgi:predicted enzyme related to lactoylglutathione lyase